MSTAIESQTPNDTAADDPDGPRMVPTLRPVGWGVALSSADQASDPGVTFERGADLLTNLLAESPNGEPIARAGRSVRPTRRTVARQSPTRSRQTFLVTSRWEGVVTEIFGTYFSADVIDLVSGEPAYVEFDLSDISESDRALCEPGALFYWSVGYDIRASGQRSRSSVLKFRRMGN